MKKARNSFLFILFATVLFALLAGCETVEVACETQDGTYQGGGFALQKPYITGQDMAMDMGNAFLKAKQNEGYFPGYKLQTCTYYTGDSSWVLVFYPDDNIPGATLTVKLDEMTGAMQIWVDE